MYVRGSIAGDWAALPENQFQEVSDNVLAVTIPIAAGDYQFKVADAGWQGPTNCGGSDNPTPIPVGAAFTLGCSNGSQNLGGGGGGGGEEPEDSTIIRIYAKDVLAAGSAETLLKTVKGLGQLDVDELRQGGATRITRIEIENTGEGGDIGVEDFAWTANPRFALAPVSVDIFYNRPEGVAGTRIAVGGQSPQNCVATTSGVGCVVRDVQVPPFANTNMVVTNTDGSSETILFNSGGEDVFATSGAPVARPGAPGQEGKAPALPRNANEVILFYKRDDGNYTGWGLHLFPLDPPGDAWTLFPTPGEFPFEGIDPQWGAYFRIALPGKENPRYSNNPPAIDTFPAALGFIIHKGDIKDPGPDQVIRIAETGNIVYVTSGVNEVGTVPPTGSTALRWSTQARPRQVRCRKCSTTRRTARSAPACRASWGTSRGFRSRRRPTRTRTTSATWPTSRPGACRRAPCRAPRNSRVDSWWSSTSIRMARNSPARTSRSPGHSMTSTRKLPTTNRLA